MKKILLILLTFIYSFSLELTTKVLEPNEAFKTSFTKNKDNLTFKLELGKDIYLYDDKLKILIKKQYRMQAINLRFMISTAIIMWMLPVIIKHIQKRMMMEKHLPFHCGMAENRSSYVHNFTLGL
jgi:thiol:disulfide interchange protein